MARRRGFFAELQHQSQVAARQADQRQRAAIAAAQRSQRAHAAAQRSLAASARASEADRKRLEREAHAAHVEAMQADVDDMNDELAARYSELDGLLTATLDVDDYVDLSLLRREVDHPPFDRVDLKVPSPVPPVLSDPPEPVRWIVPPSTALFGKQKKTEEAQALAEARFLEQHQQWSEVVRALPAQRASNDAIYAELERVRLTQLAAEEARYAAECSAREAAVAEHNKSVDEFITNLSYGAVDAVKEYVGIVLANSVYPEDFEIEHDAEFEPTTSELNVKVTIPAPNQIPAVKNYKYVKATDEIVPVDLAQRDAKARYASIAHQVALRTLHEVFEADRRSLIAAISIQVGARTNDPATGQITFIPFVAVGADRARFSRIELAGVLPSATLEHLGAALSKSPFDLIAVTGSGVRRSS